MTRRGSSFGATWWGAAWLEALEGIAGGRGGRLSAGKRVARRHRDDTDLRVEAGGVHAVIGDLDTGHEVFVGVRALRDDEWDAVADAIGAKAAHAAALLDGELDPGVVDDARSVEVELLPRPRDLHTICTCPDDAEPCEHAAAVCYLLADALDADPFVLLRVRGRRRDEVLDSVRARRRAGGPSPAEVAAAPEGAPVVQGLDPAEAWSRSPGDLPSVPPPAAGPGRPAPWPSDPPSHAPFDAHGLKALAEDAAKRAWELAIGADETGLDLDERGDLARRVVSASPVQKEQLALRSGVKVPDLDVLAAAWEFGGSPGVRANDEPRWTPPPLDMARARDLLVDAGMVARRVHVSGNRVTAEGRIQLRRSRDGRWYLFTKETGRWALAAPPEDDLDDLIDVL